MEDIKIVLIFAAALGVLIFIRVMATKNSILGKICRWYWNTSFKIAAFIPFCGWMTHFIIANPEEKQIYINIGQDVDQWALDSIKNAAERDRIQRERDEAIRSQLAQRGLRNVSVNYDGTHATAEDKRGNKHSINIRYE